MVGQIRFQKYTYMSVIVPLQILASSGKNMFEKNGSELKWLLQGMGNFKTRESAHAWNLITLCLLIAWGIAFIFMVHLSF